MARKVTRKHQSARGKLQQTEPTRFHSQSLCGVQIADLAHCAKLIVSEDGNHSDSTLRPLFQLHGFRSRSLRHPALGCRRLGDHRLDWAASRALLRVDRARRAGPRQRGLLRAGRLRGSLLAPRHAGMSGRRAVLVRVRRSERAWRSCLLPAASRRVRSWLLRRGPGGPANWRAPRGDVLRCGGVFSCGAVRRL